MVKQQDVQVKMPTTAESTAAAESSAEKGRASPTRRASTDRQLDITIHDEVDLSAQHLPIEGGSAGLLRSLADAVDFGGAAG